MLILDGLNCTKCENNKMLIIKTFNNTNIVECSNCGVQFFFHKRRLRLKQRNISATQDIYTTYEKLQSISEDKKRILVENFIRRHENQPMAIDIFKRLVNDRK